MFGKFLTCRPLRELENHLANLRRLRGADEELIVIQRPKKMFCFSGVFLKPYYSGPFRACLLFFLGFWICLSSFKVQLFGPGRLKLMFLLVLVWSFFLCAFSPGSIPSLRLSLQCLSSRRGTSLCTWCPRRWPQRPQTETGGVGRC